MQQVKIQFYCSYNSFNVNCFNKKLSEVLKPEYNTLMQLSCIYFIECNKSGQFLVPVVARNLSKCLSNLLGFLHSRLAQLSLVYSMLLLFLIIN